MTKSKAALTALRGGTHFACPLGHAVEESGVDVAVWVHRDRFDPFHNPCSYGYQWLSDSPVSDNELNRLLAVEVYDDE